MFLYQHAYHGHTCETVHISPYKFAHAGGVGQRDWVHVVAAPCTYRGLYRSRDRRGGKRAKKGDDNDDDDKDAAAAAFYAQKVEAAVAKAQAEGAKEDASERGREGCAYKRGLAAFFLESGMSVRLY